MKTVSRKAGRFSPFGKTGQVVKSNLIYKTAYDPVKGSGKAQRLCFGVFCFSEISSYSGWPEIHYSVQVGLELMGILLPLSLKTRVRGESHC